jgi:hypothetical protein
MTPNPDLVILVPGKDEKAMIGGLLARHESLGTRAIAHDFVVSHRRDPGCFHEAEALLRLYVQRARFALVLFDHEGSGQERRPAEEVERDVLARLHLSGWTDRAAVVVLQPELEVWVWSDSPVVDQALGWEGREPTLRRWLEERGDWVPGEPKPHDPKRAVEAALAEVRLSRSSAIYGRIAEGVSFRRCSDPSFLRLKTVLQAWFPVR